MPDYQITFRWHVDGKKDRVYRDTFIVLGKDLEENTEFEIMLGEPSHSSKGFLEANRTVSGVDHLGDPSGYISRVVVQAYGLGSCR